MWSFYLSRTSFYCLRLNKLESCLCMMQLLYIQYLASISSLLFCRVRFYYGTYTEVNESILGNILLVFRDVTLRQFDSIVSKEYDILVVD